MDPRIAPVKDGINSWSVAIFERERPHVTDFIKSRIVPYLDDDVCRRVLIQAPVKSGKREMVEYMAIRDESRTPDRVHAFVSSFHRIADEAQRNELKVHNLTVFSLTKKANAEACIAWVSEMISKGKKVVLHVDECDFASGHRQILSQVYNGYRENLSVTMILYSATPQEVLFSGEVEEDDHQEMIDEMIHTGEVVRYNPPATFCGPARFLDAGLIEEAKPFFEKTSTGLLLTPQGREIMEGVRASIASGSGRNVVILRLSYSDLGGSRADKKANKAIYQFLSNWSSIPEMAGCLVYADKEEKDIPSACGVLKEDIKWSNRLFWYAKRNDTPIVVVVDQTSSRSTEWAFHDRVYATHDFRNSVTFSVVSQAQERVNHYEGKYGGFQPIRVYGHRKTFLLSAGRIPYPVFMNHDWIARRVDSKTVKRLGLEGKYYKIVSMWGETTVHPEYPDPISEDARERVLREIDCNAEIKVSIRVKGGSRMVHPCVAEFVECNKETFRDAIVPVQVGHGHNRAFENPFSKSEKKGLVNGKYVGYLREWKVFDFDEDIVPQSGWGVTDSDPRITICYKDGVCGVAFRARHHSKVVEISTLSTYKSMYAK